MHPSASAKLKLFLCISRSQMHHLDVWIGGKRLAADLHMIQKVFCDSSFVYSVWTDSPTGIVSNWNHKLYWVFLIYLFAGNQLPWDQTVGHTTCGVPALPPEPWLNKLRGHFCICNKMTRSVRGVSVFTHTHTAQALLAGLIRHGNYL